MMGAMRWTALGIAILVIGAGEAFACDLKTAIRQTQAANYVEGVRRCLSMLPPGFSFDTAIETDNIARVNRERTRRGLKPLLLREDLRAAARWHSMDMAANDFFSHRGRDYRSHDQRVSLLDRTLIFDASRENIAMMRGHYQPGIEGDTLHTGLIESTGHRKNILAENISHIAVGVVRKDDGVWLTQLFVNEAGELSAPAPVRLSPGQAINMEARLNDWRFGGFQLRQGGLVKKFKTTRHTGGAVAPSDISGDVVLSVRGERPPPDRGGRGYYIDLSGPLVTMTNPQKASRSPTSSTTKRTQSRSGAS